MEKRFRCKNEALPAIAGYVLQNMKRDRAHFESFSPRFQKAYIDELEKKIEATSELINPRQETVDLKAITERIYQEMDALLMTSSQIEGYLKLGKKTIPISGKDFGLTDLRKAARTRDAEAAVRALQLIRDNLKKYDILLKAQGLSDQIVDQISNAENNIALNNQLQYEILRKRAEIVRKNTEQMNLLYDQIREICDVGKVLYGKTDPEKLKGYTFTELMKSVRAANKLKGAN